MWSPNLQSYLCLELLALSLSKVQRGLGNLQFLHCQSMQLLLVSNLLFMVL